MKYASYIITAGILVVGMVIVMVMYFSLPTERVVDETVIKYKTVYGCSADKKDAMDICIEQGGVPIEDIWGDLKRCEGLPVEGEEE